MKGRKLMFWGSVLIGVSIGITAMLIMAIEGISAPYSAIVHDGNVATYLWVQLAVTIVGLLLIAYSTDMFESCVKELTKDEKEVHPSNK